MTAFAQTAVAMPSTQGVKTAAAMNAPAAQSAPGINATTPTSNTTARTLNATTPTPNAPAPTPSAPDPAAPNTPYVLDHGHTDIFDVSAPDASTLDLRLKEDVSAPKTMRDPESVILNVKASMFTTATQGLSGIDTAGYVLPMVQENNSLWPGWDTFAVRPHFSSINLVVDDIDGPGKVMVWENGTFGIGINPVAATVALTKGSVIPVPYPAHRHVNWLFTTKGVYHMHVHAEGESAGKTVKSTTRTYTWVVGQKVDAAHPATRHVTPEQVKAWKTCADVRKDGVGEIRKTDFPDIYDLAKKLDKDNDGVICPLPRGRAATPAPPTNNAEVAAPQSGTDTPQENSTDPCIPTTVGGSSGGGSHTIPSNTHVHPNWVFTKPGTYKVSIRQRATTNAGKTVTADTSLTFNIGGRGTKNSGHFDLGSQLQGGTMIASLKDDSVSPARWVNPSSVTFGVSNAAQMKAVKGMEFIAPAGTPVWVIPATQIPGVPWLGANTQHPSIVNGTRGGVTWTLTGVSGPGKLAVFEAGNFGKAVGKIWFTSGGGQRVVGRTASGEECDLAQTGSNNFTLPFAVLGGGIVLLGAGFIVNRAVRP